MTVVVNWRDGAACREVDWDLFFPVGTAGPALARIAEAKQVCLACPVQAQCLDWALGHSITDGVWGGTTAEERRAVRGVLSSEMRRGDGAVVTRQDVGHVEHVRGRARNSSRAQRP
jgi:WhiB family transcriptional regulator, redox-sensing transcriptional regulator